MSDLGWINLHRKILDWEWYSDVNTCRLFIHMLLKANWKDGKFRGTTVSRGSFVSSLDKLSKETSLTTRELRTAISHLKTTGELTVKATNRYSIFTVENYDLYQHSDIQIDNHETDSRQSNDDLTTTIEKSNKGNKEKNKNTMCKADALALFEDLWKLYPSKKGKAQVSLAAKQRLLKVGYEEMTRAIDRYKAGLEKDSGWRKPQNGSTFFNSGYVDYLDANYQEQGADDTAETANQNWGSAADYYNKKYLMADDADKKGGDTVGTDNQSRGQAADFYKRYLGSGDSDEGGEAKYRICEGPFG